MTKGSSNAGLIAALNTTRGMEKSEERNKFTVQRRDTSVPAIGIGEITGQPSSRSSDCIKTSTLSSGRPADGSKEQRFPIPSTSKPDGDKVEKTRSKSEYQLAKRRLDNAKHILKLAEQLSNSDNPVDPQKIEWARKTLLETDESKVASLKRIRSVEEVESAKKQKTKQSTPTGRTRIEVLDSRPYSEVVKLDLRVCVVDTNDSEWRVSLPNFNKIENKIIKEIFKHGVQNPNAAAPVFKMNEKFRGHHIVSCDSQSSVDFLRSVVGKMKNLWEGANLEVKLLREIPSLPKLFIAVPMDDEDKKDKETFGKMVLGVLAMQNPSLPAGKWKILRIGDPKNDRALVTLRIDSESGSRLVGKEATVNYGCRGVRVKVTNNQNSNVDDEIEKELIEQLATSVMIEGSDTPLSDEDAAVI